VKELKNRRLIRKWGHFNLWQRTLQLW
jgi:hypothetical protein